MSEPVVAAIPNFNHGQSLRELVPQVRAQGYHEVVILDDASTDPATREALYELRQDAEIMLGNENVGAGPNRNRILDSRAVRELGSTATIHFLDADVRLQSVGTPDLVREAVAPRRVGLAGGLVVNQEGRQSCFNYGPPVRDLRSVVCAYGTAAVLAAVEYLPEIVGEAKARQVRQGLEFLLHDWPNTFESPLPRNVDWVMESNLMIRANIFSYVGGFNPTLRYHEIQDLAGQLIRHGFVCAFEPRVVVSHKAIEVRGRLSRKREELQALVWLIGKYGL